VLRHGNPAKVVTPKANFRFDKAVGLLALDTIHPTYTLDEIRENTGFDLRVSGPVAATPAPTFEELDVLRRVIRKKMIDTNTYAAWAQKSLTAVGEAARLA
jgi:hypothetical protein